MSKNKIAVNIAANGFELSFNMIFVLGGKMRLGSEEREFRNYL